MTLLCINPNAAIDKRYDLASITIGGVQRVTRVRATAGGKGLNAARGALRCGHPVVVTGFVGGFAGDFIAAEARRLGLDEAFVRVQGESRTCINIVDDQGASTELLEPGVTVADADAEALRRCFSSRVADARAVTISGSLPPGCPDDLYAELVERARQAAVPVILDTSGPALAAALAARPTVAKPNREELAAHTGLRVDTVAEVLAAASALREAGPEWVVASLGREGAVAVGPHIRLHVAAPPVTLLNPVGCGDVLVGVLAGGLAEGQAVPDALPRAVRFSAAAAAHPETGDLDPVLAESLTAITTDLGSDHE